ncbi:MAG: UDP-N-acetylmuramate--L-alanine ligase [Bryobacterales bacterium]
MKRRRLHFIGIGGIGMSGIAEILLNLGYRISGSDLRRSAITDRLSNLGAVIHEGHAAEHVTGADVVVYSSAIAKKNPEYAAAAANGVPLIMRGELLAELMRLKFGIAVGGSHGKTTTTSMTAAVLQAAEKDPTVVVGGKVGSMGSNARLGKSDFLLVEADESDGSFLRLAPIIAVITNVDREHLDHYQSDQEIEDAFVAFANKVPFYGSAIVCIDDPVVRRLIPRMTRRVRTYGSSPDADLVIRDIEHGRMVSRFALAFHGRDMGAFEVFGAGRHNVLNAAAAALVALELGAGDEQIREGLRGFIGVDRRFQIRGERGGVTVVDDYGHHPTEIRATLSAARNCGFRRIHVLFQPHRYSRTELLEAEFAACFGDCDSLEVVDIYAASEEPRPGVNSLRLVEKIQAAGAPAAYAPSIEEAVERAVERAQPGDAIVTLGAGNIFRAADNILAALDPIEARPLEEGAAH